MADPTDVILNITVRSCPDFEAFCQLNRSRITEITRRSHGTYNTGGDDDADANRGDCQVSGQITECTLAITFSTPPGQSRARFVIGRDASACDVIYNDELVSRRHFLLGFDREHIVMDDVSSTGSSVCIGERGYQQTYPTPARPYRIILPLDIEVGVVMGKTGVAMTIVAKAGGTSGRQGFRVKRDKFLGEDRSDNLIEILRAASQLPTPIRPHNGREWRPMYWFEEVIGQGAFGTVSKVRRLDNWCQFAAKELSGDVEKFVDERDMFKWHSTDERIVNFVDWYEDEPGKFILVMEYCPHGNLSSLLRHTASQRFDNHQVIEILAQVAEGLAYLNRQGITHRDINPNNILVRSIDPIRVVLGDFGFSKAIPAMFSVVGTPNFLAPELGEASQHGYTNKVDVWSLGVVGMTLLGRELPGGTIVFNPVACAMSTANEAAAFHNEEPANPLATILRRMLSIDPQDRPTADECASGLRDVFALSGTLQGTPSSGSFIGHDPYTMPEAHEGSVGPKNSLQHGRPTESLGTGSSAPGYYAGPPLGPQPIPVRQQPTAPSLGQPILSQSRGSKRSLDEDVSSADKSIERPSYKKRRSNH